MSDDRGRASPDSQAKLIEALPMSTLVIGSDDAQDETLLNHAIAPTEEYSSPHSEDVQGPNPLNQKKTFVSEKIVKKSFSNNRNITTVSCPHCGRGFDKMALNNFGTKPTLPDQYSNAPPKNYDQAHRVKSRSEKYKDHLVSASSDQKWGNSYWSFLDLMLGTTEGQWCALIVLGMAMIFTGTLAWIAVGGNDDVKPTFFESSWLSWGLFFDPGTQTGIGAHEPFKIKFVALFFSVLGFIFNLAVLGLIVDQVRKQLEYWKETRNRTVLNGHTIILGWGPRTLFILNELLRAYDADLKYGSYGCYRCRRRRRVLIMADEDVLMMQRETRLHLETSNISRHGVYFRRGEPQDWIQLRKTSPNSAGDIIIMGKSAGSPQESDQLVLQILLALAALPKALQVKGEVVAEMRALENVAVAKNVLIDAAVIEPRYAANRMLCLSGLSPAIGTFMDELVSFQHGDVLFLSPVPPFLVDKSFEQALRAFGSACLIGVKGKDDIMQLAPPWDHTLGKDDTLVYLAEHRLDFASVKTAANSSSTEPLMAEKVEGDDVLTSNKDVCALEHKDPKIICIIGCPSDFSEFIDLMLAFCECEIYILSEKNEKWRKRCMNMAFSTERHSNNTNNTGSSWDDLKHVVGPTTSQKHLLDLPFDRADCVFILAERTSDEEDPFSVDSRSLNTIITINKLLGVDLKAECVVVCELIDPRSEYVVHNNLNLAQLGYYFHSNKVETALISMCAEERNVFNTLQTLLEFQNETDVITVPVAHVLQGAEWHLSFWDLQVRLHETVGGILIGWCKRENRTTDSNQSPRTSGKDFWKPNINPGDKNDKINWKDFYESLLIVVRREPSSGRSTDDSGGFSQPVQAKNSLPGMVDDRMS